MRENGIIRTDSEIAAISIHSTHRTKIITAPSDEREQAYCLDCEVKYSTGFVFAVRDY